MRATSLALGLVVLLAVTRSISAAPVLRDDAVVAFDAATSILEVNDALTQLTRAGRNKIVLIGGRHGAVGTGVPGAAAGPQYCDFILASADALQRRGVEVVLTWKSIDDPSISGVPGVSPADRIAEQIKTARRTPDMGVVLAWCYSNQYYTSHIRGGVVAQSGDSNPPNERFAQTPSSPNPPGLVSAATSASDASAAASPDASPSSGATLEASAEPPAPASTPARLEVPGIEQPVLIRRWARPGAPAGRSLITFSTSTVPFAVKRAARMAMELPPQRALLYGRHGWRAGGGGAGVGCEIDAARRAEIEAGLPPPGDMARVWMPDDEGTAAIVARIEAAYAGGSGVVILGWCHSEEWARGAGLLPDADPVDLVALPGESVSRSAEPAQPAATAAIAGPETDAADAEHE